MHKVCDVNYVLNRGVIFSGVDVDSCSVRPASTFHVMGDAYLNACDTNPFLVVKFFFTGTWGLYYSVFSLEVYYNFKSTAQ